MLNGVKPLLFCCLLISAMAACRNGQSAPSLKKPNRLVISKSAGPRTFNRLLASDEQTNSITDCLMGRLVRINRQTQQPEAELATAWQTSADGRTLTCELRRDVVFSDGIPFTADDVVFTFQVLNDPAINSPSADPFDFDGQRVTAEKLDERRVRFVFPKPYAAAERLLDGVPILPKHLLEAIYRAGQFMEAWTPATPPDQIVGLGPFKLKEYVAGQRVVMTRNEHYWKKDSAGRRLPYLDELIFTIDPDRNTQLLKFRQGESDLLSPVNADDVAALLESEQAGRIKITDLGPSLIREILWFNLNDEKQPKSGHPLVDPVKLGWFKDVRFRQAVSHAIDRDAIARLVFAGKASPQWGFLSPGDKLWFNAEVKRYPHELESAKRLLADAGFQLRGAELFDAQGHPVTFTLLTNAGNTIRQKMSAMIQADLAQLGIKVNSATMESRALLATINDTLNYEACLLAVVSGDADPTSHANILSSAGLGHWWHPRQKKPATAWEARIDELIKQQASAIDPHERKKLFDEVQVILAEQQPFIFLASRHLIVAAKTEIGNLKPALLPDFMLWNCEELIRR
ncbi:MAG TPA: ABC transporter substrate-binding protein [Blastocatellia bacterium]|nr:ABC transporter substrate-binding protein [Blastocatellia bacterium]HMX26072.1 ABC transporter substrate-binding protein [Blastocatellia bacterium]HMY71359.1 ABC transporter substrate-binding protein [Blastocatellia bacterium]HNG32573.1 ABC transporter substrate-binding protein [Blastocatellia bacterium]